MMNMFLGEDVFQKSVANYLKKYKYSNAAQDDLWEALTQTAHERGILQPNVTVKMIMDTWTLQTGYPLLTVVRDYEKNTVTITQASVKYSKIYLHCFTMFKESNASVIFLDLFISSYTIESLFIGDC